jgi:hypothetical protein
LKKEARQEEIGELVTQALVDYSMKQMKFDLVESMPYGNVFYNKNLPFKRRCRWGVGRQYQPPHAKCT